MKFPDSREKVKRAMKHIRDLDELISIFSTSDFYSLTVKEYRGQNCVFIIFVRQFPETTAALIIGDALHNMRSALDLLYYRAFDGITAMADHRTRFPIRDTREELISSIDGGLKEKKLVNHAGAIGLRDFVVNDMKAYQTGNWPLWALHDMNITDKHKLLIPVFKIMRFADIRLEDQHGEIFLAEGQPYFTEDSYWFKAGRGGKLKVHDKGHAATGVAFSIGIPLQDKPVIPSLTGLAENVTSMIDAFEALELLASFD